jgi:hypothetical protein
MKCADSSKQLVKSERLREVIVRTGIQSAHHVLGRIARGKHQDGSVPSLTPQLSGDLEAVFLREHHVKEHRVVVVDVGQHRSFFPIAG